MDKNLMHQVSITLLWIGGLNWGLYGLFGIDLVTMIFGPSSFAQLVYILVGVAAVYSFTTHKDTCKACMDMKKKGKKRK